VSVLVLGLSITLVTPMAGAGASVRALPDGFVSGAPHILRVRPVIGDVPAVGRAVSASAAGPAIARFGAAVVATCDLSRVTASVAVPTTDPDDDEPGACVVNAEADSKRDQHLLLGAARLTGSDVASARVRTARDSKARKPKLVLELGLTDRGVAAFASEPSTAGLVVVVDGEVLRGELTTSAPGSDAGQSTLTLVPDRALTRSEAEALVDAIGQSRSEEVIGFADQVTMTRSARRLFGANAPQVVDKVEFQRDCPTGQDQFTYVLGCQGDSRIFLLRVDRPDLAAIMPVTAAHEMLHAAYAELAPRERRRIDRLLDEAFEASADQRLRDTLAEYAVAEPGQRHNELHSILPTEVAELSPALERYYERYFDDRGAIVTAFNGYQGVFDALQAQYDQLSAEAAAIEAQLTDLEPRAGAAGAEADRLAGEIDRLRRQGRFEESNGLVDAQNAAVNLANELAGRYNDLVAEYNVKVEALNSLAITAREIDAALGVEEAPS
jgi:hypothetical protein